MVDLVAGTSTGGILACGADAARARTAAPLYSAEELAGIYVEEGPRIFRRSLLKRVFSVGGWIDERYEDDGLNAALDRYLGDARLSDALDRRARDRLRHQATASRSSSAPRARAQRPDVRLPARPRSRARPSAAPTYFEPAEVTDVAGARTYPLIDGGVYAVNPSMCAYADVVARRPRGGAAADALARHGRAHPRRTRTSRRAGGASSSWARPVLDMVFDGVADTIEFEAATLMGDRYMRLQTDARASPRTTSTTRARRTSPPCAWRPSS